MAYPLDDSGDGAAYPVDVKSDVLGDSVGVSVLFLLSHGSSLQGGDVGSGTDDALPYAWSFSDSVDGPSHQYG